MSIPLCLQAVRPAGTCAPAAWRVPPGAAARGTGETKGPAAGLASVRRALRQVDRALVASRALHFGVAVRESSRRLIRSSGRVSAWLRTRATLSGQQSARSAERAMEQFDHDVMLIGLLQAEVRDPGRRRRGCAGRYPGTASPPGLTPRCRLSRRPRRPAACGACPRRPYSKRQPRLATLAPAPDSCRLRDSRAGSVIPEEAGRVKWE
jgi:hypothetical protein